MRHAGWFALSIVLTLTVPARSFADQDPPAAWVREVLDWHVAGIVEQDEGCRVYFVKLDKDDVNEMILRYPSTNKTISKVRVSRWRPDREEVILEVDSGTAQSDVGLVNGAPAIILEWVRRDAGGMPISDVQEELLRWNNYRFDHNVMNDCSRPGLSATHCVPSWNQLSGRPCVDFPR